MDPETRTVSENDRVGLITLCYKLEIEIVS